jgi:two-component system, LytTR family, response regulator
MKVLIVDDEPVALRGLQRQLAVLPGIECVGACDSPAEVVHEIKERHPDVVLLDIKLGGSTAFDIIEEIGADAMPLVIFVTAYDRHALKAFEMHALDYVLKPVDPMRLREALERAASLVTLRRSSSLVDRLEGLLASLTAEPTAGTPVPSKPVRFAVREGERVALLDAREIDWFESAGNWVRVHARGKTYIMRTAMDRVATRVSGVDAFVRVRRSAILNVRFIATLEPYGKGTFSIRLRDGGSIVSSRFYSAQLRRLMR